MSKVEGFSKMRFVGKPGGKLMKGAPGNFKHGEIYVQPFHLSSFPFWELVEPKPELNIPEASKSDSVFEDAVFVPDNDAAPVEMNTPPTEVAGVNVDPNAPAILEPYMRLNLKTGKLTAVPDEPKLEPKPEPEKLVDSVVEETKKKLVAELEPKVNIRKDTLSNMIISELTEIKKLVDSIVTPAYKTLDEPKLDELKPTPSTEISETTVQMPSSVEKTREELQAILDTKGVEYPPKTRTTTLAKMVEDLEKPFE